MNEPNSFHSLLKAAQECANVMARSTINAHSETRHIRMQLDQIEQCIGYLLRAQGYTPSPYPNRHTEVIPKRITYAIACLHDILNALSKQPTPNSTEALEEKEHLYLKSISLLNKVENREDATNASVQLCLMFKQFLSNNPQSNTIENITRLYKYTCDTIAMCRQRNLPTALPVTDILVMYARVIHNEKPLEARDVLISALSYCKNGHCHNPDAEFLCLKGLAANYIKLVDRRYGYINDENADQEIDACYQLAIQSLLKALDFQQTHAREPNEIHDCSTMLSIANFRLGFHYAHLYYKTRDEELLALIEHWYSRAIHWAQQANDRRKAGIAYNQLAHHFLRQEKNIDGLNCLQKAIDNLMSDLDAYAIAPLRLPAMKTRYQELTRTLHPQDPQYIDFCAQLATDLIDLSNALKEQEAQRFYRFTARTDQPAADDRRPHPTPNAPKFGGRR